MSRIGTILLSLATLVVAIGCGPQRGVKESLEGFWKEYQPTTLLDDVAAAEERFLEWGKLLLEADTVESRQAVDEFVELMTSDEVCYLVWSEWTRMHLYGVWSPLRNNEVFEMLLRKLQDDDRVAPEHKDFVPRLLNVVTHNQEGQMAQEFSFYDKDERRGELSDFRGQRVLLLLIDTTCPSCLDMMQEVEESRAIMEAAVQGDVSLVAISLGVTPEELQPLIVAKEGTPWQFYCSGRGTLESAYHDTEAAPILLLLSPEGRVEVAMTRDVKSVAERLK